MTIPLTQSTDGLPNTPVDTILEDYIDGDFFFDALEDVDSSLDSYADVGDYTFLTKDPYTPLSFPLERTANDHGEHVYCHILGANVEALVSESEDDGSLPSDHTFWAPYLSNEKLFRPIYQGMLGTKSILGAFQDRVCWHGASNEL